MTSLGAALLVSLVAALLVLPPIGQRIIATSDEARFALLARDVLERGAWFDVQVRGKQYRNKPPLYPWSIAVLSFPRGRVTEATAHAPVALAAIGTVLVTFLLGDRLFSLRAGFWAALVLATSFGFFAHSQLVLPDMLVVFFSAVSGYAFWRSQTEPPARGALAVFYTALAFGVFAKGPVGLLPLLVAALWLWLEAGARALRRLWSPLGVGLFLLVTLSWLAPFLTLGSGSFAEGVLWGDWLTWYLGPPRARNLRNLAEDLLVGALPWGLVAPLALASAVRRRRTPSVGFALLWTLVPLGVVLLSANQRTRYLLPVYPGLALLVGWWADAHGTARTTLGRVLGWGALVAATAAIAALVSPGWFGRDQSPYVPGYSWEALPLAAGAALVGIALYWGLKAGRPALLVHGVVAAMVVLLACGIWPYNRHFNDLWDFRALAAGVERHARGAEAGVFGGRLYGGRYFSLDFYLGRPVRQIQTVEEFNAYVARPERPVVVVRGPIWRIVRPEISPGVQVLERLTIGGQDMLIVRGGR